MHSLEQQTYPVHLCRESSKKPVSFSLGIKIQPVVVTTQLKSNRPFPSSPGPLFQKEGGCSAFDMEIIFLSHAIKTHFHKKGCAPSLSLKVRVFGARKWPILVAH